MVATQQPPLADRILAVLAAAPEPRTWRQIVAAADVNETSIYLRLQGLGAAGLVTRMRAPRLFGRPTWVYMLTAEGRAVAEQETGQ